MEHKFGKLEVEVAVAVVSEEKNMVVNDTLDKRCVAEELEAQFHMHKVLMSRQAGDKMEQKQLGKLVLNESHSL